MDRARPEAAPRILTLPGIVPRFLPRARVRHGKGITFLHVGLKPPPPIITQKSRPAITDVAGFEEPLHGARETISIKPKQRESV
jgi:hypothetical protein